MIEQAVGNAFKTRIYPIPRLGTRTVRVTFMSQLTLSHLAKVVLNVYTFPLCLKKPVKRLWLQASIETSLGASWPYLVDMIEIQNLPKPSFIQRKSHLFQTEVIWENIKIESGIRFGIPNSPVPQAVVGKDDLGNYYFAIQDLYEATNYKLPQTSAPKNIAILWDCSRGREALDKSREISLLKTALRQLANVTVYIICFSNDIHGASKFQLSNGNSTEIINYLNNSVVYDGATSLGSIHVDGKHPFDSSIDFDFYMMFTDGINTWGDEVSKSFRVPVYIFSSSEIVDSSLLKIWANKSGGEYFFLSKEDLSQDEEVARKLGIPSFLFLRSVWQSEDQKWKDKITVESFPSTPQPVHGNFKLAGKISLKEKHDTEYQLSPITIELHYGHGVKILRNIKVEIKFDKLEDSPMEEPLTNNIIPRFWASKKIQELLLFPDMEESKASILTLGRNFGYHNHEIF